MAHPIATVALSRVARVVRARRLGTCASLQVLREVPDARTRGQTQSAHPGHHPELVAAGPDAVASVSTCTGDGVRQIGAHRHRTRARALAPVSFGVLRVHVHALCAQTFSCARVPAPSRVLDFHDTAALCALLLLQLLLLLILDADAVREIVAQERAARAALAKLFTTRVHC